MFWRIVKITVRDYVAAILGRQVLQPELQYRREFDARRKAAADRAELLLLGYLTREQRNTYRYCRWFIVRGQSGRRYSISAKDALYYNVTELDSYGQIVSRLCAHAAANIPMSDHLLTQKLMLEHHEAEFWRVANREM